MEYDASVLNIGLFLEKYGKNKKLKLLDIGCSDGEKVLKFLGKKEFSRIDYVGLDSVYWDENISKMPQSSGGRVFVHGDACNMPFEKDEFDLIILSHVFEHIQDSEKLCSEINRVAKKEGKILVIVPLEKGGIFGFINRHRNLWRRLRIILNYLKIYPYRVISPHVHLKSYEEYKVFFEEKFNVAESCARGSFRMFFITTVHENLMGFGRRKINLSELIKNKFPNFFHNSYPENKYFKMSAAFILSPKNK